MMALCRSSASSGFARRWTLRLEPFPGRAGAKIKICLIPSSISPNFRRSSWATSSASTLTLPEEVLVTVMRDHQKYFARRRCQRKAGAALSGGPEHRWRSRQGLIRHGNERVLRARFKRCAFLLGYGPEEAVTRTSGDAEVGDVPEGPGQLPRQDRARSEVGVQPDFDVAGSRKTRGAESRP